MENCRLGNRKMNNYEKYKKIKRTLIVTLYNYLFPLPEYPTAQECKEREGMAINYYLGMIEKVDRSQMIKFHDLIDTQMSMIVLIREIEE